MRTTIEQTISFGTDGQATDVMVSGWSDPESEHTWMVGTRSVLCIGAPAAPFGYLLEITWSPYTLTPGLRSQPVTISVGDQWVATHEADCGETVAFRCPPPRPDERRLLITFDHPGAAQPSVMTGHHDQRLLSLCVRTIRVLTLESPWPAHGTRASRHAFLAHDLDGLRREAEQVTGRTLHEVLSRFEVIAGNCDMGLALRELGFESLSLLRFAGATASVAIRGIETGFAGVGERLSTQVADNPIAEWMVVDGFGLRYHTHQSSRSMSEADVIAMQRRHVAVLSRKLIEDLAEGEKIFVYADHQSVRPYESALALFAALNRTRPTRMLWVCPDDREQRGWVEEIVPGLARASLHLVAAPMNAVNITVGGWVAVLCNAWLLFEGAKGRAAAPPFPAPIRPASPGFFPEQIRSTG